MGIITQRIKAAVSAALGREDDMRLTANHPAFKRIAASIKAQEPRMARYFAQLYVASGFEASDAIRLGKTAARKWAARERKTNGLGGKYVAH